MTVCIVITTGEQVETDDIYFTPIMHYKLGKFSLGRMAQREEPENDPQASRSNTVTTKRENSKNILYGRY